MRVTVIPFVNGALGTVPKDLERGLRELEPNESRQLNECKNNS